MNSLHDDNCKYCGSTMYRRGAHPHCSGDNLHYIKGRFDEVLELESSNPDLFSSKLVRLQDSEYAFDLFSTYWNLKKNNPDSPLECIHEDTYFRSLEPETHEIPMPPSSIPFPDLAEVYIAEIMLGRELTDLEKDESVQIPKIDENGQHYWGTLTWIKYPRSYMSESKATDRIKDLEPLPKVFDIEDIRDKFKGR